MACCTEAVVQVGISTDRCKESSKTKLILYLVIKANFEVVGVEGMLVLMQNYRVVCLAKM